MLKVQANATLLREIYLTTEAIRSCLTNALDHSFPRPVFEKLNEFLCDEWDSAVPIRGFLTRLGYEVGGGCLRDIVEVAAAIELAQLATLVVDDVIDRSEVRSGWSAYKVFGEGVSLLAGEMLKSCSSALLAKALEQKTHFVNPLRALRQFEIMYERINVGQLLDLLYESSPGISEREYLRMTRLSTGGFLEGSAAIGSTLSGAPDHLQKLLRNYACCLGIGLQIYDDVLDLFPQPGRTKPFANDLKRRKQRLPLIHFLHTCSPRERGKVDRILGKERITDKDAEIVARLLVQQGSAQYALRRAKEFCSRALFSAARITPASVRHLLVGLVDFIPPEDASWLETGL